MTDVKTYFLYQNPTDGKWEVVDNNGWPYASDCETPEDALGHVEDVFGITDVVVE